MFPDLDLHYAMSRLYVEQDKTGGGGGAGRGRAIREQLCCCGHSRPNEPPTHPSATRSEDFRTGLSRIVAGADIASVLATHTPLWWPIATDDRVVPRNSLAVPLVPGTTET